MGYFIQPILTDKASSETALAIQNREPLVFTRIALGSGRHRTDIGKKNNVVQVVHSLQVAQSLSTDVADTIRLTARFDNSQIDREIIVNEIGVFAKRGNHEEFMYMYTWAEQGDVIPSRSFSVLPEGPFPILQASLLSLLATASTVWYQRLSL